ncbi:MAG: putative Ig domain-containing protein, partial [Bryocella sp.]
DDEIAISISFDEGKTWEDVQTSWASDYDRMYVDLNPSFPQKGPARYAYILRFTLRSQSKTPEVALNGLYLRSTLEMSPLAMPGVMLGENKFTYTDDSPGARKVRITQVWNECDADIPIPAAPVAVEPVNGDTYSGTRVKFQWSPRSDGAPADYEFALSEFSDMRWPLSPNFHKLISRTAYRGTSKFELPYDGLLNPGQKYYWHVRARSQDHVWGPWSKTYWFSTVAPAVPIDVTANFDHTHRTVQLKWQRGKNGTAPVNFKIYGSDERGFTANDNLYEYNDGLKGTQQAPANLLLETNSANGSAQLPDELWRPYYRIVAVDRKGRVSGPSAMAELSHPLIATTQLPAAIRAIFYQAQIMTSASIGHLVSADENGLPYQLRFRSGDDLVFHMTGAPTGLSIDKNGLISGFVGDAKQDKYEVTIEVQNKTNGASDSVKLALPVTRKP